MKKIVWLGLLLLLVSSPLFAQAPTAVDGTYGIEFSASTDHAALNDDGTPVVDHYEFLVIAQSNGALFFTQGLLKPQPNAQGVIRVVPIASLATLVKGVTYVGKVSAVGPGGAGTSTASAPFQIPFTAPRVPGAPSVPVLVR